MKQFKIKLKNKKEDLGASLLGNILACKGVNRTGEIFFRTGYGPSIKNKDF